MRGFEPGDHHITTVVLHIAVFIMVPKFNILGFAEGSGETLERNMSINTDTEFVEGLGNFELPEEPPKTGPGEGGKAHQLSQERNTDAQISTARFGMNMICSDEISLDRTVPDLRHEECKHWNYPEDLPKVSVIVIFHNEGFSVLMRTVHSIINRSPPQFLEEVILVDDYSNMEDLKDKLESYIQRWGGKVRLIRNKEREGLINTRSRGAREAHGEIIVFLDAHCEVNKNWLPPLISPIFKNRTTMTVPIIDSIDNNNFEISSIYGKMNWRGIFEWGMQYKENFLPAREHYDRTHHTEPYRSPTHAGGLFAINKEYFLELGTYDPGLLVWGGENFELSFKIWQCGGSILWVPCSRVGHVYKAHPNYNFGSLGSKRKGNLIIGNYKRVVETWMDEKYKEYFYRREPRARYVEMGDISEQLKLKEKLQCKSFQWYLENVAYDVLIWTPEAPPNKRAGNLKNEATQSCIASDRQPHMVPAALKTGLCEDGNNIVRLNVQGQLGILDNCVVYAKNEVKLDPCWIGKVGGPWQYNESTHNIYHKDTEKCMAVDHEQESRLTLLPCDPNDTYQLWSFMDFRHLF